MDTDKILGEDSINVALNKAKNSEIFNESTKHYWVGFPKEVFIENDNSENKKQINKLAYI